jgi:hypothetical protein
VYPTKLQLGSHGGGKYGGAALDVPAWFAVSEVTYPLRLAVMEMVVVVEYPTPLCVTVAPDRVTLPEVVPIVYVFAAS